MCGADGFTPVVVRMTRGDERRVERRTQAGMSPREDGEGSTGTPRWIALLPAGLCLAGVVILILMRFID